MRRENSKQAQNPEFNRLANQRWFEIPLLSADPKEPGDAHAEDSPPPELVYRFGAATGDAALASFGAFASQQRGLASGESTIQDAVAAGLPSLARSLQEVLAVPQIMKADAVDALPRDAWYPALALMVARKSGGSTQGFFLAVQASGNGRSHGHNDTGSFIVFVEGEPLFIDVGVEAYTAKTFSRERYTIWTMQSAYHNLPTIGGVMQHEGASFHASSVQYRSTDAIASLSMDLAGAYPAEAGATRWTRTVSLDRERDTVTVSEDFALRKLQPVMLTFLTPRQPRISAPGAITLQARRAGSSAVRLQFNSGQLTAKVEAIELKDEGLSRTWGPTIYRVLLVSAAPVARGMWEIRMEKETSR